MQGFTSDRFTSFKCDSNLLVINLCSFLCHRLRHIAVLVESIKKGIRDADSEARVEARK